ncbi:MAG: hypothetical protein K2H22_02985, partial [Muribaculaceae bacterium]|nr:hypothetical protein [Muribaculaceae bacterium]
KMISPSDFERPAPQKRIPNDLGGNFSSWSELGIGKFNGDLGLIDPIDDITVYYCTTDPYGYGVDSWYFEGLYDGVRLAGMPFIEYFNIGSGNTGLTYMGKPVMYDELSTHYDIGMESHYDETLGLFQLAFLYYVDDPDEIDNVIAYGYETVQLAGDFKDYRVDLSIAGETKDSKRLKVNNSFVDAENVKIGVYPRAMNYPDLITTAASQREDESIPVLTESAAQYFELGEDGTYTALMTYTGKDGAEEFLYDTYEFDSKWTTCGTADFTDDYLASYYTDFPINTATGLKLQKHNEKEIYRIVNPYTTDDTWTSVWNKLQAAEPECNSYFAINVENKEKVYIYINPIDITLDDGSRLVVGSAAHYNIINDRTDEQITEKGYWGKAEENADGEMTITFPQTTLMMRPINSEYPLFAGYNDAFKAVLHLDSSSVNDIETDINIPAEYYTPQGMRVDKPTKGIL